MTAAATARWQALGTTALVRVCDQRNLKLATRILQEQLDRIDLAASSFRDDSELARLLRANGSAVIVSDTLRRAVQVALIAAELTDGLVDPTLGVGWRDVESSGLTVRVPAGTSLDLGATGKALTADDIHDMGHG